MVLPCGREGYSLCVSEHSSDANTDPANIIIIIIILLEECHGNGADHTQST